MKYNLSKKGINIEFEIKDDGTILCQINNERPFKAKELSIVDDKKVLVFGRIREISVDGKTMGVNGISIPGDIYFNAKKEHEDISERIEAEKKKIHDNEKNAILSGEKPLNITYKEGEYYSGYTTYDDITEEVLEENGCGHYLDGWGFAIDEDYSDGNLKNILRNGAELRKKKEEKKRLAKERKEKENREREELVSKVDSWDIEDEYIEDEDGKTKMYTHIFVINGHSLRFSERNVFDFGRVINPMYSVEEGLEEGGLRSGDDWQTFDTKKGWHKVRELTEEEKICMDIVTRYGGFAKAGIRM